MNEQKWLADRGPSSWSAKGPPRVQDHVVQSSALDCKCQPSHVPAATSGPLNLVIAAAHSPSWDLLIRSSGSRFLYLPPEVDCRWENDGSYKAGGEKRYWMTMYYSDLSLEEPAALHSGEMLAKYSVTAWKVSS